MHACHYRQAIPSFSCRHGNKLPVAKTAAEYRTHLQAVMSMPKLEEQIQPPSPHLPGALSVMAVVEGEGPPGKGLWQGHLASPSGKPLWQGPLPLPLPHSVLTTPALSKANPPSHPSTCNSEDSPQGSSDLRAAPEHEKSPVTARPQVQVTCEAGIPDVEAAVHTPVGAALPCKPDTHTDIQQKSSNKGPLTFGLGRGCWELQSPHLGCCLIRLKVC